MTEYCPTGCKGCGPSHNPMRPTLIPYDAHGCPLCVAAESYSREGIDGVSNIKFVLEAQGYVILGVTPTNPLNSGHVIFFPSTHTTRVYEDPNVTADMFSAVARYCDNRGAEYNIFLSRGVAAGEFLDHISVNYIPRSNGDGLGTPTSGRKIRQVQLEYYVDRI